MIQCEDALRIVLDAIPRIEAKDVPLAKACGRILAEDIIATRPVPPFDNSSMDGYAVASGPTGTEPIVLRIAGESSAGTPFGGRIGEGEAVRVMTGGKIPPGAGSVVPVERTNRISEDRIEIRGGIVEGSFIRRMGEDIQEGERALPAGTRVGPPQAGMLAALGVNEVRVSRMPSVNILATGDELVEPGGGLEDGQIRNSTSSMLMSYVRETGGRPRLLGSVPDKQKRIRKAIRKGLECDILLVTGGVSVGEYDLVKEALEEVGAERRFWGVNIKPGRPLVFATLGSTLIFGLPGNPVSTSVTFLEFVRPALNRMMGCEPVIPGLVQGTIEHDFGKQDGKRHFLRGIASIAHGTLVVRTTGTQSSGALSSMVNANCFIVIPESVTEVKRGDAVQVRLFHPLHS